MFDGQREREREGENSLAVINLKFAMFNNCQHFSKSIFLPSSAVVVWCEWCVRVHFERLLYTVEPTIICVHGFSHWKNIVIWCTHTHTMFERRAREREWTSASEWESIHFSQSRTIYFVLLLLLFGIVFGVAVCLPDKHRHWKCLLFYHLCTGENVHLGFITSSNGSSSLWVY